MELIMAVELVEDARRLRRALESDGDEVTVSLSRSTAELVVRLVAAQALDQETAAVGRPREVSPNDAAAMMGVSRAQVRKLIDDGKLPFRMVGSHHRIRMDGIVRWLRIEDVRQAAAMAELMALQNELGLTE
jgi:excisionase family DNA binding protein